MKKHKLKIFTLTIALFAIGLPSVLFAQTRATNSQIRTILGRIETKTDTFKREVDLALDRSQINNTNREDRISDFIADFENATDAARREFDGRRDIGSATTEVLNRAVFIDRFMDRNRLTTRAQNQWTSLKNDLNTLARYHTIAWNWNQQMPGNDSNFPPYTVSETQLRSLLARIETKSDTYKRQMDSALDRSVINNTNREDSVFDYITEFENATDELKRRFDANRSVGTDASEVLTRAAYIDRFMRQNRLSRNAESQWLSLRTDLNTLATYYRVSWNWNQTLPPFTPGTGVPAGNTTGRRFDSRLTGTYRLNTAQSDNVLTVIDRSLSYYTTGDRDRVRRNLERRLESPEMIAIEKNGASVTLASSNAPQVTFQADGTRRTETNNRGRTITTTATADRQDGFSISYVGDRANDFFVSFMPDRNGQLKVTRRIYLENRSEQITVSSVYDKTDNVAIWSTVNDGNNVGTIGTGNSGDFVVPNGTRLTAALRNTVTTRDSQTNDRFTMEVTTPSQYRGAVIEGRVIKADSSGRVSGRATVSLDFDTIRLTNGQSHRFAGIIDSVTAANGDSVSVNNEGTVRDGSRTTTTATRAGIGAVIGAIVGAIAGGGTGAAIGAGVGAGAGAGTVLIQGRDNIELGEGSQFNITASAPGNVSVNRY